MEGFFAYAFALCAVLLFASLSALVSERAGVVNIGIEGMMTIGALITAILGTYVNKNANGNYSQIWVVLVAAIFSGFFALLHALPAITLRSNQIVSSTALNILAMGIAMFLATSGWFGPNATDIDSGYETISFGRVFPMWLLIAILATIGIAIFFNFTRGGMRFTMTGENPNAVDAAGISVVKIRYWAVFFSGILAGLAGGVMITTVIGSGIFIGGTYGFGFLALAIMIFGQWRVPYLSLGVILFAFLFALGNRIGFLIDPQSDFVNWAQIFKVLPFVLTLVVMVIFAKKSKAPAADGVPFDKARR
ncbi:simple sugar transport system permease protein [Entomoplasma freundtii]|uniref:Ribose/galactose ABC transporter permease n=1 Tax=Entomoplasma freundtii TaxID=74700 RepID=A0A2K8NV65_9MOLU|nr:ABC transporter permease [Entomoplasma freundtii]ATZ16641.1 ribose/galactose ABC transporter permease [Entomoplasma freundtii]TDY58192.1 simple sugar transport system permease protein [Entomoplasma freundtii]